MHLEAVGRYVRVSIVTKDPDPEFDCDAEMLRIQAWCFENGATSFLPIVSPRAENPFDYAIICMVSASRVSQVRMMWFDDRDLAMLFKLIFA